MAFPNQSSNLHTRDTTNTYWTPIVATTDGRIPVDASITATDTLAKLQVRDPIVTGKAIKMYMYI